MSELVEIVYMLLNHQPINTLIAFVGMYLFLKGIAKILSSPHIEIKKGIDIDEYINIVDRINSLEDDINIMQDSLRDVLEHE